MHFQHLSILLFVKVGITSSFYFLCFSLSIFYCSCQVSAKARRLYDVANILTALHLLEKTTQTVSQYTSSKPAYKFLGAEGVEKYLASIAGTELYFHFGEFKET